MIHYCNNVSFNLNSTDTDSTQSAKSSEAVPIVFRYVLGTSVTGEIIVVVDEETGYN